MLITSFHLTFSHIHTQIRIVSTENHFEACISLCRLPLPEHVLPFSANFYTCKRLCIIRHQLWQTFKWRFNMIFDLCPLTKRLLVDTTTRCRKYVYLNWSGNWESFHWLNKSVFISSKYTSIQKWMITMKIGKENLKHCI